MMGRRAWAVLAAALLAWTLSGCGAGVAVKAPVEFKVLTVEFSAAKPLPAGAEILVRVVEITGPDRRVIAQMKSVLGPGQSSVAVNYDPALVQPQYDYNVEVSVIAGGKPVAASAGNALVLSKGRGERVRVELAE